MKTSSVIGLDETSEGNQGGVKIPEGLEELCNEFTEIHKSMVRN